MDRLSQSKTKIESSASCQSDKRSDSDNTFSPIPVYPNNSMYLGLNESDTTSSSSSNSSPEVARSVSNIKSPNLSPIPIISSLSPSKTIDHQLLSFTTPLPIQPNPVQKENEEEKVIEEENEEIPIPLDLSNIPPIKPPPQQQQQPIKLEDPISSSSLSLSDIISKSPIQPKIPQNVGVWRNQKGGGRYYISLSGKKLIGKAARLQCIEDKKNLERYKLELKQFKNNKNNKFQIKQTNNKNEMKKFTYWNIPQSLILSLNHKGVYELYDWQVEALCSGNGEVINNNKNFVYTAPTSGGKSLVADLLLFRKVILEGKKGMIILPYISLIHEKANSLENLLNSMNIIINTYCGNDGGNRLSEGTHIAITTIEKSNSIINRLIEEDRLSELGIVVIDEIHTLNEPSRGYLLEIIMTKLLIYKKSKIQIIGLSATLPNIQDISKWINGYYYICNYRPVPLHEYFVKDKMIYDRNNNSIRQIKINKLFSGKDNEGLISLCFESYSNSIIYIIIIINR